MAPVTFSILVVLGPGFVPSVTSPVAWLRCFFRLDLSADWDASGRSDIEQLDILWWSGFLLDILARTAPPNSRNILEMPDISGAMLTVSM